MEHGHLLRALGFGGRLRAVALDSSAIGRELVQRQDAGPLGAIALSRIASACVMMSAGLKARQQLSVQISHDGPLGELYAISDAQGRVRATVADPRLEAGETGLDLSAHLGAGRLVISRRLDEEPAYRGVVALEHRDLALDLAHYYNQSEQIPTAIALGEWLAPQGLEAAGGVLIQALPGALTEDLLQVESRLQALSPLSEKLRDGIRPEEIIDQLLDEPVIILKSRPYFYCGCDLKAFEGHLRSLGVEDLHLLAEEQGEARLLCHFCGAEYIFSKENLLEMATR